MNTRHHLTDEFIELVNSLINKGVFKNKNDVVEKLQWNKSVMSSVMNGKLKVPFHIYTRLKNEYLPKEDSDHDDYKAKYIKLLEMQATNNELILAELKEIKFILKAVINIQHNNKTQKKPARSKT